MEVFFLHWILPALIVGFAATVQGVTGFGSGLVAMSLLPILWDISFAVGVVSPFGVVLTILLAFKLRHHIQLAETIPLLVTMPFGVGIGLWILEHWPNLWMKAGLGVLLIIYVLLAGQFSKRTWSPHPSVGALAGFLGGICGGAFSASGPPVLIYAAAVGWSKNTFRANLQVFFMATSILGFAGLVKMGVIGTHTLPLTAACLPGVILGGLGGNRLASMLPQETFRGIVSGGLLVMGIVYVSQSVV